MGRASAVCKGNWLAGRSIREWKEPEPGPRSGGGRARFRATVARRLGRANKWVSKLCRMGMIRPVDDAVAPGSPDEHQAGRRGVARGPERADLVRYTQRH
jgi:hypothetical protein